jgi:oxygen-independent coproporphyrinogen-3 oxidase
MSQLQVTDPQSPLQAGVLHHDRKIPAVYLHLPFCFHKCHYCDFYSIRDDSTPEQHQAFIERLCSELAQRASQTRPGADTLFIGGGTPTRISTGPWSQLLRTLADEGYLKDLIEFTVEANPETLEPALLGALRAGGVNRLSIGCQSFQPELLKTLERWHEPASVPRSMALARKAGLDDLNLDLIFAIPGQSMVQLDEDLSRALDLGPTHLSCYNLMYEPNTAFTQRMKLGRLEPIDEDTQRRMYERVIERLDLAGFEHYELSNWARPGRECRHNLHYWHNRNWLGFGPSAASHVEGYRWKNKPSLRDYLRHALEPPVVDFEHLGPDERIGEWLMLGLRLIRGLALDQLHQRLPAENHRWETISYLRSIGMLEQTNTHLRLTHEGLMLADRVAAELL